MATKRKSNAKRAKSYSKSKYTKRSRSKRSGSKSKRSKSGRKTRSGGKRGSRRKSVSGLRRRKSLDTVTVAEMVWGLNHISKLNSGEVTADTPALAKRQADASTVVSEITPALKKQNTTVINDQALADIMVEAML